MSEAKPMRDDAATNRQERTLIFEIALPDFYAEDLDPSDPTLREMYAVDGAVTLTPEEMWDAVMNESGIISGGHVRVVILTGSKGGNELQRMDGFIVGAKVLPRVADHEREKDERLDDYEERWVEYVARRLAREEERPEMSSCPSSVVLRLRRG